jgi:hypothetical protein
MMRRTAALFAVLALAGCSSDKRSAAPTTTGKAAADVSYLVQRIEEIHPDPWHAISEADFKAAAMGLEGEIRGLNRDEQLVELMRLTALLGERDGHSGIFPLDAAHERALHLYPLRLYEFSDGVFVVDAIDQPELVGARVVSIAGRPLEEVLDAVRPLVPADNEMSRRARLAQYIVVEEVLRGLGFSGSDFELDGETVTLDPVEADVYAAAFEDLFHPMVPQGLPHRAEPPYLARRLEDRWIARLPQAVYAAYNLTLEDTTSFAAQVARTAPRPVILDLRHNPGGNNGTYPPLLEVLRDREITALIGRTTFSAAGNLITELELSADVLFVGEPSGAAPNLYGDPVPVELPTLGWTVHVAGVYWEKSTPDDFRVAIEPEVRVDLSSTDFFAGRDPVLRAALRRAPR